MLAIEDWTVYSSISETAEAAAKFVYYVKITDHAGNVTYFGSDGVTFDLTAPRYRGRDKRCNLLYYAECHRF